MSAATLAAIIEGGVPKGDVLSVARIAGIQAAKRTSELIPLCHPLVLSHVSIEITPTRAGYAIEARVLGCLIEKELATPEYYPLTLNALTNACNQKSNRDPVMALEDADVVRALESLRTIGAAAELFGSGRVPRYRHHLRDWLGVEGPQAAILAELLLRGEQSEGDLRVRASRMERGYASASGPMPCRFPTI